MSRIQNHISKMGSRIYIDKSRYPDIFGIIQKALRLVKAAPRLLLIQLSLVGVGIGIGS